MKRILCLLCLLLALYAGAAAEAEYRYPVQDGNLSLQDGLDSDWRNILLMGADERSKGVVSGRSDAMLIVSVNRRTGEMRLTSLARDMWVHIAGTKFCDRINTAFRYGGPDLAMKTVNETLLLNIEDYAAVSFYGLCDIVDYLGGIECELDRTEINTVNKTASGYGQVKGEYLRYKEGESVTLCGAQALAYARIRKIDSDFERNRRQRNVLMAIAGKVIDMDNDERAGFIRFCLEQVDTNLNLFDIMTLGLAVLGGGLDEISQLSLPLQGDYRYMNADGRSVWAFDLTGTRDELHGFIYGEPAPMPATDPAAEYLLENWNGQ